MTCTPFWSGEAGATMEVFVRPLRYRHGAHGEDMRDERPSDSGLGAAFVVQQPRSPAQGLLPSGAVASQICEDVDPCSQHLHLSL